MGFMSAVIADQRQTIDNDLSASALAAARGGIEDGKRILVYCKSNPTATGCTALGTTSCDAFTSGDGKTLSTTLGISFDSTTGEGMTGGSDASAYRQYFSCLTINTRSKTMSSGPLDPGDDYIRPLTTASDFNSLKVSWSGDENFSLRNGSITGWPTLTSNAWSSMPVVRLQVIKYMSSSFSNPNGLNNIEADTKTVYIVPCNAAGGCPVGLPDINTADQRAPLDFSAGGSAALRTSDTPSIVYAPCKQLDGYSCEITLAGFTGGPGKNSYYIRASVLYGSTTLTFSPYQGGGQVSFDNVQPIIDVTGRTNDVYKRVRAEIGYEPTIPLPTDALSSAAPICKNMIITNALATTTYSCD